MVWDEDVSKVNERIVVLKSFLAKDLCNFITDSKKESSTYLSKKLMCLLHCIAVLIHTVKWMGPTNKTGIRLKPYTDVDGPQGSFHWAVLYFKQIARFGYGVKVETLLLKACFVVINLFHKIIMFECFKTRILLILYFLLKKGSKLCSFLSFGLSLFCFISI